MYKISHINYLKVSPEILKKVKSCRKNLNSSEIFENFENPIHIHEKIHNLCKLPKELLINRHLKIFDKKNGNDDFYEAKNYYFRKNQSKIFFEDFKGNFYENENKITFIIQNVEFSQVSQEKLTLLFEDKKEKILEDSSIKEAELIYWPICILQNLSDNHKDFFLLLNEKIKIIDESDLINKESKIYVEKVKNLINIEELDKLNQNVSLALKYPHENGKNEKIQEEDEFGENMKKSEAEILNENDSFWDTENNEEIDSDLEISNDFKRKKLDLKIKGN